MAKPLIQLRYLNIMAGKRVDIISNLIDPSKIIARDGEKGLD